MLLIVVIAIRKRRDPGQSICDGKNKQLGMYTDMKTLVPFDVVVNLVPGIDKTVTTPLDMGMGQQRFIVAYTLKQGVEKQPDILSAQKSSESMISLRASNMLGSPAAIRPDGLFSTLKHNYVSKK